MILLHSDEKDFKIKGSRPNPPLIEATSCSRIEVDPMATEAQISANARNAQKSTGPRTPEGKGNSCKNRLKHGLRSEEPVLRTVEDEAEWLDHLQTYIDDAQPIGDVEFKLAEKAAMCLWKQARVEVMMAHAQDREIEAASFGHVELEDSDDNGLGIDLSSTPIDSLQRYYDSFEAGFFRAYRELEKRRIERKKDAERAAKYELQRRRDSLKAPRKPTIAMIVAKFQAEYDEDDLAYLLGEDLFDDLERKAALQIQKERQRDRALAEHRTKVLAEASGQGAELGSNAPDVKNLKNQTGLQRGNGGNEGQIGINNQPTPTPQALTPNSQSAPRAKLGSNGEGTQVPVAEVACVEECFGKGDALSSPSDSVTVTASIPL